MLLTMAAEYVGAAEIADMLGGVSRQRAHQIITRATFPKAAYEFRMGKIWRTAEVEAWIREHRPTIDAD